MPRNASGNFTLPLPAVVTGTVIESVWANTTMNDLAASITDSLDRYGRGGMVAPFRMVDGTVSVPAISFASETNTGLYRVSAGVASISVLGVEQQTWTSAGTTVANALNVIGELNATGPLEIGGGIQITGGTSRFLGGNPVLITGSANASLAPFVTRWFVSNVTPILQMLGTAASSAGALLGRFSADNAPPMLFLSKSRNATVNSHTIVQIGDCLGGIHFGGSDGVQIIDAARIAAFVDAAPGVDVMPTRLTFWTTSTNQPVERMRLSADGLGLGISSFLNAAANRGLFEMSGATDAMIAMKISGSNRASLLAGTNFDLTAYGAAAAMTFSVNTAERMRIDASGNVGVATTAAAGVRMHIKGAAEVKRMETTTARGGGNNYMTWFDPSGRKGYIGYGGVTDLFFVNNELATSMLFYNNGSQRMEIDAAGRVGINSAPVSGIMTYVNGVLSVESRDALCGLIGIPTATDYFTIDTNKQVASYGLAWKSFSDFGGGAVCALSGYGGIRFYTGSAERVRIDNSGRVGIGMVPAIALDVQGQIRAANGSNGASLIGGPAPLVQLFYSGVADWRILVDSTASLNYDFGGGNIRARLTSVGAWIVGTNTPFAGIQNAMSQSLEGVAGYGVLNHANGTANGTNYFYFGYNVSVIGSISQATTASVAFNTTSDARLKENVVAMPDVGAIVDALQPRLFNFISDPDHTLTGLIAQEAVEVLPEIVHHDANYDSWGIDYGKLTPLLLREIQSLRARVAALEV